MNEDRVFRVLDVALEDFLYFWWSWRLENPTSDDAAWGPGWRFLAATKLKAMRECQSLGIYVPYRTGYVSERDGRPWQDGLWKKDLERRKQTHCERSQ
jgi:hypothetical protein